MNLAVNISKQEYRHYKVKQVRYDVLSLSPEHDLVAQIQQRAVREAALQLDRAIFDMFVREGGR